MLSFNVPKTFGDYSCHFACLLPVSLWTDLTLCSVCSLFRFLSSSCFFFSILLSRLVSSETTLLSMSLVFSTLSLTMNRKARWQIQCHFTDENRSCVSFKNEGLSGWTHTKTSLMAALRAFSVSLISRGLAMAAVLISCGDIENKDSRVISCITVFSNWLHYSCTAVIIGEQQLWFTEKQMLPCYQPHQHLQQNSLGLKSYMFYIRLVWKREVSLSKQQ